jgi:hypothetical protein
MKRALAVWRADGYRKPTTELCAAAGVARRTWYNWFDSPDFRAWWENERDKYMAREITRVYGHLLDQALHDAPGNVRAAKLLLERFDRQYRPQHQVHHSGEIGLDAATVDLLDRWAALAEGDEPEVIDAEVRPALPEPESDE